MSPLSGTAVRFWNIAKNLHELGCKVVYLERGPAKAAPRIPKGMRVFRSPVTGILLLDFLLSALWNICASLLFQADVVFASKPLPNSCIPALLSGLLGGYTVLDVDDLDYEYYSPGIMKEFVRYCFKFFPRRFDKITYHVSPLAEILTSDCGMKESKLYCLPQGVDSLPFIKAEANGDLIEKLGLNGHPVIAYLASLGITSGMEKILDIFKKINQRIPHCKLMVIGGGSNLDKFKAMADKKGLNASVLFIGHVATDHVPRYLKLANAGINYMSDTDASRYRASLKLREYLAAGLPSAANPVGDAELFKDYVILCHSEDEFAAALSAILQKKNADHNKEMQIFVKDNFDWRNIVYSFIEEIEMSYV